MVFETVGPSAVNDSGIGLMRIGSRASDKPQADEGSFEEPKAGNPYLQGRREWNERYGSYIAAARTWRFFCLAAVGLNFALAADNYYLATKAHTIPYIVERDRLGNAVYDGPALESEAQSPLITRSLLQEWVIDWRSVYTDPFAQRRLLDWVYAHTSGRSVAREKLNEWYQAHQPFDRAKSQTVQVEIQNTLAISDRTWQVTWLETTRENDGRVSGQQYWQANLTFERSTPRIDSPEARADPTGLYVSAFDFSARN